MNWKPLPDKQKEHLEEEVKFYYRTANLYHPNVLSNLDGELDYMRYHADLSEPARAFRPMAFWFGFYLTVSGWWWAEDESGNVAVISPDSTLACLPLQLTGTLFDDDKAPYFSELAAKLAANEPVDLEGIIKIHSY